MGIMPGGGTRLDQVLPTYDFHEIHSIVVPGTPAQIFDAIKTVAPEEIPLFQLLMGIRGIPGWLAGQRRGRVTAGRSLLRLFVDTGFLIVAETAQELVVGGIGQFWKPWGGEVYKVTTAEAFAAFHDPGYVKTAINFVTSDADQSGRVWLRTETRILATDPLTRRKFGRYWSLIHPGSAVIRRMWLRTIRRRVER